MTAERLKQKQIGDRLYEQYAKPLEREQAGKYIAIASDGRTVLGDTVLEVAQRAKAELDARSYLFKVGPRVVWRLR